MNKIICGHVLTELLKLEPNSIDLIITSPPYFGQREYKSGSREIGLEKNVERYLNKLSMVFRLCIRVCKPDGNIIFNMGDKYIGGSLQLIPYQFALMVLRSNDVKLINEITWVKSNPTPRQYNKRLVLATEPFFHFVKSDDYYYNIEGFMKVEKKQVEITNKKGDGYYKSIRDSQLTADEKDNARKAIELARHEMEIGEITDFRMKIRGVHKKPYGGQVGGRNNQIDKDGFTLIRMYGRKIKRDIIETPVAQTKNIDHPAIFPLKVIEKLVLLLSKENSIILDPFCGSGQVCLAAKSLDRRYLGIDLNSDYCKLAQERLNSLPEK